MYRPLPNSVTIKDSDLHGLGLFAIEDIPKNILNFFDSIGEGYCKNREKN